MTAALSPSLSAFKGLRADVLLMLRKEQPLTAGELASRLAMTANGVRRHLKELEERGLVRFARESRGVGGPVYAFSLTDAGEQLFPRDYVDTLADALEMIRALEGPAGVTRIFRRRWETILGSARAELDALPLPQRARRLASLLSASGYMAESSSQATTTTITEHNCAIREIAARFPEVCDAEADFIADVLGAPIERQQHMMHGCAACEYTAALPAPTPLARALPQETR